MNVQVNTRGSARGVYDGSSTRGVYDGSSTRGGYNISSTRGGYNSSSTRGGSNDGEVRWVPTMKLITPQPAPETRGDVEEEAIRAYL